MSKVYVKVDARFDPSQGISPLCMFWEDGTRYEIDRVLDVRKAASLKAGGMGMRYRVRILGKERSLFLEEEKGVLRWFVEGK